MIQRIQTVLLFMVAIFTMLMFSAPLAKFLCGDELFVFSAFEITHIDGGEVTQMLDLSYLAVAIAMGVIAPFFAIFYYKNRKVQIKLCILEMIILLGLQGYIVYQLLSYKSTLEGLDKSVIVSYSALDLMPALGILLTWLAMRAIKKDEKLVRSLDRIR